MRICSLLAKTAGIAAVVTMMAGAAQAGEKAMMHCFAYTVIETATDAEWQAFYRATDELPHKIKGIKKVWYGKLRAPLAQYGVPADARKKLTGGEKSTTAEITFTPRKAGVCMEMENEGVLKTYAADPFHKEWVAAYEKVRVAGTTTFDILGQ